MKIHNSPSFSSLPNPPRDSEGLEGAKQFRSAMIVIGQIEEDMHARLSPPKTSDSEIRGGIGVAIVGTAFKLASVAGLFELKSNVFARMKIICS